MRTPGETNRDLRLAALERQVRELQAALDIACAELADDDQDDDQDDDENPDRKDG